MSGLYLKSILGGIGAKQSDLARSVFLSPATISQIVNHGLWPKKNASVLKVKITEFLREKGVGEVEVSAAFNTADKPSIAQSNQTNGNTSLEEVMLLKKHRLTQEARRAFKLLRDPFEEVRS
ncbi:hypothetical protein TW85_25150, partial [Marinomonas sp. S3726]|uniref:hypothetical protein n=1 Tax=Marinomonas sp. S3726 TaxID=579484 RepID=UPI0005FA4D5C